MRQCWRKINKRSNDRWRYTPVPRNNSKCEEVTEARNDSDIWLFFQPFAAFHGDAVVARNGEGWNRHIASDLVSLFSCLNHMVWNACKRNRLNGGGKTEHDLIFHEPTVDNSS